MTYLSLTTILDPRLATFFFCIIFYRLPFPFLFSRIDKFIGILAEIELTLAHNKTNKRCWITLRFLRRLLFERIQIDLFQFDFVSRDGGHSLGRILERDIVANDPDVIWDLLGWKTSEGSNGFTYVFEGGKGCRGSCFADRFPDTFLGIHSEPGSETRSARHI